MPIFVPRVSLYVAVACGALVLAGVGVAMTWQTWGQGSDLMARGAVAYSEGDWRQAADLARRRLKAAPQDVEALRLLARTTARLGRDGPANALFARLGSDALEAEDLYLLGIGLDRAGRSADALRMWEKSIQLQPDRAETLDRLIVQDMARNRLTEAAQLAERLARHPGWELRGELALAVLRAELIRPGWRRDRVATSSGATRGRAPRSLGAVPLSQATRRAPTADRSAGGGGRAAPQRS